MGTPVGAQAHPLGNFTINHLSKLTVSPQRVDLRYVLDLAEIPAFQAMREADPSGRLSRAELEDWAAKTARTILPTLQLRTGSLALPFILDAAAAHTRHGAGGLPTLYLRVDAHALPQNARTQPFAYHDDSYPGRLGWRDVVVAPEREPTRELTVYPNALLGSPRAIDTVVVALTRRGATVVSRSGSEASTASNAGTPLVRSNQLSDMLARGTGDLRFVLLTLLVAIVLGALHALEPGHGKTLLAVSLVGARATVEQAGILAAALTVAHTSGVLLLGVAISLLKGYFVPEAIYPWITLLSGVAIAIIGARALQRQLQARQPLVHAHGHGHDATHDHDHVHAHHPGAHEHAHGHGQAHDHDDLAHARLHAIPGDAPLGFWPTVGAAMSGAVAPCPAALVVLLAALALDRVAYGVIVIVAFSLGLALTLTGLGIAVVRGARWLERRPLFNKVTGYGPLASAVFIAGIGTLTIGQGLAQQGVAVSPLAACGLIALAIAGYALSHPFAHRTEPA